MATKKSFDKDTLSYQQVEMSAYQEMLRQVRQTYNIH